MDKQDLTTYSTQELSLLVFNTEYLYTQRHTSNFQQLLDDTFIYRQDQLDELTQDLADEAQ